MPIITTFPAGGGAKLNVQAYSDAGSLPASDKDYSIAVITSTAINDVYASADEPASPATGDVWIALGASSVLPIILKGDITIYPRRGYQYISSAWAAVTLYAFTNSAWEILANYVYNAGTFYGGNSFNSTSSRLCTISLETGNIQYYMVANVDGSGWGWGWTTVVVDLTGISKIRVDYNGASQISGTLAVSTSHAGTAAASVALPAGGVYRELDVSALSGDYYIGIYFATSYEDAWISEYVTNIELL